jgi:hypothetical protein
LSFPTPDETAILHGVFPVSNIRKPFAFGFLVPQFEGVDKEKGGRKFPTKAQRRKEKMSTDYIDEKLNEGC